MTQESKPTPMLQDASTSDDMRSLLTFARAQGPGQGDLDRLAQRLSPMVGISALDLSVPPSDLSLGTAPPHPPGYGPTLAATGKGALVKIGVSSMAKSIAAAALVSAGVLWWAMPSTPVTKPAPQVTAPVQRAAAPVLPTTEPPAQWTEVRPEVPERKPAPKAATLRARPMAKVPSAAPVALPSEIELIRRAEDARGQPALVLRSLSEHARLYPNGMLAQEREVLAIEALLASGDRRAAEARADALAVAHPGSAHLRRVRVLLGSGSAE